MKRALAFLTVWIIFFSAAIPARGEEEPSVYSYDFDFRFSMNADEFPARSRARMQGYSELLDALELKGNATWCPEYDSFDLNVRIIPVSNPDSSVSFRLFGIPSDICLSSPLLGNETVWFDNFVLMEFAMKAWKNFHIPLQYVALLLPYVTENAFSKLTAVWDQYVGTVTGDTVISARTIQNIAKDWKFQVEDSDTRLGHWILALSSAASDNGVLENEFMNLADYLLNQVTYGGDLQASMSGNTEAWTNEAGETLFTRTVNEGSDHWTLSLPATSSGYVPRISVFSQTTEDFLSLSAEGSYNLTADPEVRMSGLPESLLDFSLRLHSWPLRLFDGDFTGSLKISGLLLPGISLSLHGKVTETGEVSLELYHPVRPGGEVRSVLTCSGTVTPAPVSSVPHYTSADMHRYLRIFGVNDQSLNEFVKKVTRPLFYGMLDFLYELPARGCQSVMDDLEEYGILDMLLSD